MKTLEKINSAVEEAVSNNMYDIIINMDNYYNESLNTAVIIPSAINSVTFLQSTESVYNMTVVIGERNSNITVKIENLKINTKQSIAFDFRGTILSNYESFFIFSGINNIISEKNIAVCVSNNKQLTIQGTDNDAVLTVSGGAQCCAIGNRKEISIGGSIILTGEGTINVYGGNAESIKNITSKKTGIEGGIGIGFVPETKGRSQVKILNNINVTIKGGKGQNINSASGVYFESYGGKGGNAISGGRDSFIQINTNGNFYAYGGDGGDLEEFLGIKAGDGGNAIFIICGIVLIETACSIYGGNGGHFGQGGNGGSTIVISDSCSSKNTVMLYGKTTAEGGNGGNGSIYFENNDDFDLVGGDGGNGGSIIDGGSGLTDIIILNINASLGNGGNGGSPYDLYGIEAYGIPGSGGDTGSLLTGQIISYDENTGITNIEKGISGNAGRAIDENTGEIVNGNNGIDSPLIDCKNNIFKTLNFGKINFNPQIIIPLNNRIVYINQSFKNIINDIELSNFQEVYDAHKPIITGNAIINLLIELSLKQYKKKILNVIARSKSED